MRETSRNSRGVSDKTRKAGSNVSRPHSSVVEHFLGKEEVTGSSPVVGSKVVQIVSLDTVLSILKSWLFRRWRASTDAIEDLMRIGSGVL